MPLDRVAFEKRMKQQGPAIALERTLVQLFPSDNPDSPTMWRLAIVRDDMGWEYDNQMASLSSAGAGDSDSFWEWVYFMRRMSVSVLEAKRIFDGAVTARFKKQARIHNHRKAFYESILEMTRKLDEVVKALAPIRNSIGAHVRPNDANPEKGTTPFEVRGLETHKASGGVVRLNGRGQMYGSSFRDFTKLSILFAWPEVTDNVGLRAMAATFIKPLAEATSHLLVAIDAVLYTFWLDIGAIPPLPRDV
jgi:hypothetical protein